MSKPSLYREFGSEDGLTRATLDRYATQVLSDVFAILQAGKGLRATLDALIDFGRPKAIQLVVLVDRGHRELPIKADYVGKNIPTAPTDIVHVRVQEIDERDEVELVSGGLA